MGSRNSIKLELQFGAVSSLQSTDEATCHEVEPVNVQGVEYQVESCDDVSYAHRPI